MNNNVFERFVDWISVVDEHLMDICGNDSTVYNNFPYNKAWKGGAMPIDICHEVLDKYGVSYE